MKTCIFCGQELPQNSRFCIQCGKAVDSVPEKTFTEGHIPWKEHQKEEMNMQVLYIMVGLLLVAFLFPPWETPPGHPPEFLGFHFILSAPEIDGEATGVISRFLWALQVVTIAIAGFYFAWVLRKKGDGR